MRKCTGNNTQEWGADPIERFLIAVNQAGINYLTPKIGKVVIPGKPGGSDAWWEPFIKNKR